MFVERANNMPRFIHDDGRDNEVLELIAHNGPMSRSVDNAIWILNKYAHANLHEVVSYQDDLRRIANFLCQRRRELHSEDYLSLKEVQKEYLDIEFKTPNPFQRQQIHSIVDKLENILVGGECGSCVVDEDGDPLDTQKTKRRKKRKRRYRMKR